VYESDYTAHLRKRFIENHPDAFWFKIPDFFGKDGVKKPFDAFFISSNIGFGAIESKLHKSLSPFHFNKIESHQINALRKVKRNNGLAFIVVGIRAQTTEFDRKKIKKDHSQVKADLWFPVQLIPGAGEQIDIKKFMVRDFIASISSFPGNRVQVINIEEHIFRRYTK